MRQKDTNFSSNLKERQAAAFVCMIDWQNILPCVAMPPISHRREILMKTFMSGAIVIALLSSTAAMADPGNGHGRGHNGGDQHSDNGRHNGWGNDRGNGHQWRRGERMGYNDWRNAQTVDYRQYHLRQPPRGYEWRRQNDQFVMVAVATGLIASIIMNSGR